MLRWRASETLVNYKCEVDKGKLTAVVKLEKLMFQAWPLCQSSRCSDEGLMLETSAFQNSLWWLTYPYQLYVDN